MKHSYFQLFKTFLLSSLIPLIPFINVYSEEQSDSHSLQTNSPLEYYYTGDEATNHKKGGDKLLTIDFRVIDSLPNGFCYYTNYQQPFVYHEKNNLLVLIKRGFFDLNIKPDYKGDDLKDNLFFITSNDLGLTWDKPKLIYKASEFNQLGARYPSIYYYSNENNEPNFVYTAPLTSGTGWKGFINGLYDGLGYYNTATLSFNISNQDYGWAGTDSKILGGMSADDESWAIAIGGIMPPGGTPLSITSNIAYRRTDDFNKWDVVIPEVWSAEKYNIPSSTSRFDSIRSSIIIGLKPAGKKLYMSAFANFKNSDNNGKMIPGYSVSEDNGVTWSEYDIMPWSLIKEYASLMKINDMDLSLKCNDFVPTENGDISFFVGLDEDTTQSLKLYTKAAHQMIEIFKKGEKWGLRKIADVSGYVLAYLENQSSVNQMGFEKQISVSADGSKLLAKWVDFVSGIDKNGDTIRTYTTDIFVAFRGIDSDNWTEGINITKSDIYDRTTWIPNIIPNNLVNIPLLKTETIHSMVDNSDSSRYYQRKIDLNQYILIGNFDLSNVPIPPILLPIEDGEKPVPIKPRLEWIGTNSDSYDIQLNALTNLFEKNKDIILNSDFFDPLINVEGLTNTYYDLPIELEHNKQYIWRVRSNKNGYKSEWSKQREFKTGELDQETSVRDEQLFDLEAELYPNPANGNAKLKVITNSTHFTVDIYNTFGERLQTDLVTNTAESTIFNIKTDNFQTGMYFIKISNPFKEVIIKFMIIKL